MSEALTPEQRVAVMMMLTDWTTRIIQTVSEASRRDVVAECALVRRDLELLLAPLRVELSQAVMRVDSAAGALRAENEKALAAIRMDADKMSAELEAARSAANEQRLAEARSSLQKTLGDVMSNLNQHVNTLGTRLEQVDTRFVDQQQAMAEIANRAAKRALDAYKEELHQAELERIQREIERGAVSGGGGGD